MFIIAFMKYNYAPKGEKLKGGWGGVSCYFFLYKNTAIRNRSCVHKSWSLEIIPL